MREPFAIALFLALPAFASGTEEPPAPPEPPTVERPEPPTPAAQPETERGTPSFAAHDHCATAPWWLVRLGNCPLAITDQAFVSSTGGK